MTYPILRAKLKPPPLPKNYIYRPAVIEKMSRGQPCRLILVSAPAGYGKTSLLTEWTKKTDRKVAWLSFDKTESDPTRFWAYVIDAFETTHSGFKTVLQPILQSPQHFSIKILLAGLIDVISNQKFSITLILDDYHRIEAIAIHEALASFIECLPDKVNVIISTRSDPPFPIGRLRLEGHLCELRAKDFRFRYDETAQFLSQAAQLDFLEEEITFLNTKTEGWVAGIQLAILSLNSYADKSEFFTSFSGDDRFIADYLVEEVLRQQPKEIQRFLLQTSILTYLSGQVCEAVTGLANSYKILSYLEENNLFLITLDSNRQWYRYHQLFADLLKRHLKIEYPSDIQELHQRASEWFEVNGFISEAIYHAMEISDIERTAKLAQNNVMRMINHGEFETTRKWLRGIPESVICRYPWLEIARIWDAVFLGELASIESSLGWVLSNLPDENETAIQIKGHISTISACISSLQGDQPAALEFSQKAMDLLPENDYFARGLAALNLGISQRWSGNLSAALDAYTIAQEISKRSGDSFVYAYSSSFKGYVLVLQGKLKAGYAEYQKALQSFQPDNSIGVWTSPITGLIRSFLSGVLLQWNQLDAALESAQKGLELSKTWGNKQALQDGYFFYIQALIANRKIPEAKQAIQAARQVAASISAFQQLDVFYQESLLYLGEGNTNRVAALIQEVGLDYEDIISYFNLQPYQILAKYLRTKGDLQKADQILDRLLFIARQVGAQGKELEILIEKSLVAWLGEKKSRAVDVIQLALAIAEPEEYLRVFISEGALVIDLLEYAESTGICVGYIERIISSYHREVYSMRTTNRNDTQLLIQPLSKREKQVLRLLISGFTSTEIATELTISVGTARTHIRNLYRKLEVHNRVEVVNRARELNLF